MSGAKTGSPRARRWLWIVGGAIAVVLLVGFIAPMFINVDKYRPRIEAAIEAQTGRQVTLGAIHARLLPSVAVIVDGFQLSNPKDFASGELLAVDQIRGGLTLSSLLRGDIHVTSVKLVRPRLVLTQDENGHPNYTFPAQNGAASGGTAPGASSSFSLDLIDEISLQDMDLTLQQIPTRGAQPFAIVTAHKLNVEMGNVLLKANAVKQWRANAKLDGISVDVGALAAPMEFKSGEVNLDSGVLDANFEMEAGKIADVKGTIHVPDVTNAVPIFDISTPALDAGILLASIRQTPETHPSSPATAGSSAPAKNDDLLAQGKITAERVSWSQYVGGNASAEIHIYNDRISLMPAAMVLYGGTLQLSARTDSNQEPERFSANIQMRGLDVGRMLAAAPGGLNGKMTGFADFDLQLLGSTGGAWQKALTGIGAFSIRDGKLPGVNLAGALGALARASGLNETSFTRIAGDLNVADGRVSTKQTKMDSSAGTVELAGGVGFTDQSMSFEGKAVLMPTRVISGLLGAAGGKAIDGLGGPGIAVPFSIGGTLSDPKFLPGKSIPGSDANSPGSGKDAISKGIQSLLKKQH